MKRTTKSNSERAKSSSMRVTKDLSARKGQSITGGRRSDLGQKLQIQLTEANSIYN